ncbi:hypothetical protein KR018_012641 [Drosophila ironensis]|nr:hypothetical protein KR018_012641 [Drosophila ironensis]
MSRLKCFFWMVLVFFSLVYFFLDVFVDHFFYEEQYLGENYFVNTNGCRIPSLAHQQFFMWPDMHKDTCQSNLPMTSYSNCDYNYLGTQMDKKLIHPMFQNESLEHFKCQYHAMKRFTDFENRFLYTKDFSLEDDANVTIDPHANLLRAECSINGTTIYNGVHFYVHPPEELPQLPPYRLASDTDSLSVLIVGLDSTSRLHFPRSVGETASFLFSLPHVQFNGFSRVGEDSFQCLMPLLTGLSYLEVKERIKKSLHMDGLPFLWKRFRQAGYETVLGEDNVDKSLFPGKGFNQQPTDYYLRPALNEMWLKTRKDTVQGTHCNENDHYAKVLNDFLLKALRHLQRRRYFTFAWWTQGIDHIFNYGHKLDGNFLELFHSMEETGMLRNTVIVLVSNHGLNKDYFSETTQGKIEENQPLAMICYPRWMPERFPQAISNLKINEHRLVTAFDLHETLLDFSNLPSLEDKKILERTVKLDALGSKLPRGINLFLPVPKLRDCPLAHIPKEFCLCQKPANITTDNGNVQRAARLIIRNINKIIQSNIPPCTRLYLDRVLESKIWSHPEQKGQIEIRVQLRSTPGGGEFEGLVRFTGNLMSLNGPIKRLNDSNSKCIDNHLIAMYCFCKQPKG